MANFAVTWREKKQLLVRTVEAISAQQAVELVRASKPEGSFPVSGVLHTEGKVSRIIKHDGSCYAVVVEA